MTLMQHQREPLELVAEGHVFFRIPWVVKWQSGDLLGFIFGPLRVGKRQCPHKYTISNSNMQSISIFLREIS